MYEGTNRLLPLIVEGFMKFVAIPTAMAGMGWWAFRRKHRASRSWPATTGTIESVKVRYDGDSVLRRRWVLETSYSYRVNTDWYAGFHSLRIRSENEADTTAARLRNSRVIVRYQPNAPQVSLPEL